MIRIKNTLKTLLYFTFLSTISHSQGLFDGYFKGKHNLDIAVSGAFQTSTRYLAGKKEVNLGRQIAIGGVFGAYGITNNFDVVLSVPFVGQTIQDGSLGLKYGFKPITVAKSRLQFIGALAFSTPLTRYGTEDLNASGQQATILAPKLIIQLTLPSGFFWQVQTGYNIAFQPVPSSIVASTKIGLAKNKWYFDVWYDVQQSQGGLDYLGQSKLTYSFRELGVNYQRIGGTVYHGFSSKFGAFINGSQVLAGRNSFINTTVGVGVVFKFTLSKILMRTN